MGHATTDASVTTAEADRIALKVRQAAKITKPTPHLKTKRRSKKLSQKWETRRIPVPPHRLRPLKKQWLQIYEPLVKQLHLQIRMNLQHRCVELRSPFNTTTTTSTTTNNTTTTTTTSSVDNLQKGADFVHAVLNGFTPADSLALLRLDDIYVESFQITDVKSTLKGDHLSRAIGRIAGKDGRTRFTIENATRTRIVVADSKVYIMGSFENIRLARGAICSLILGSAPGKVYNRLRTVAARLNERY